MAFISSNLLARSIARCGAARIAAALIGAALLGTAAEASADAPAPTSGAAIPGKIDFNRDIRPILSSNCFFCHGPDKNKRKADLRLDTKEGLSAVLDSRPVTVPGHPEKSELYLRVTTQDSDERMPDPKSNKKLSDRDIAVLRQWIEQGAVYKGHWAYLPPVAAAPPTVSDPTRPDFVHNDVDRFLLARLLENGLHPAPEADRPTLLRRLSFDLVGLPPTPEEVADFVNDKSPDAYEKQVDRLLANPHYGERMAIYWLDLVRYADSIGYHSDNPMNVSPYRDWVIAAFNQNEPFDRFTTEQLAGDLLPGATTGQKVASAYNRLLQTTEEGGAQPKEYIAKYAADRVRNVSTVWMGATMACCQCHDHKFDPYTAKDFYSMAAFFADVQEAPVGRREPGMPVPDPARDRELTRIDGEIASARGALDVSTPELTAAQSAWEKQRAGVTAWQTLDPDSFKVQGESKLRKEPDGVLRDYYLSAPKESYVVTAHCDLKGITAFRLEALADDELPAHGPGVAPNGNFVLTEFKVEHAARAGASAGKLRPVRLLGAVADESQDAFPVSSAIGGRGAGWAILPEAGKSHEAIFQTAAPLDDANGAELTFTLKFNSRYPQHNIGKLRLSATTSPHPATGSMPARVTAALSVEVDRRSDAQKSEIAAYYRSIAPLLDPARQRVQQLEKEKASLLKSMPTCLVSISGPPRTVRILPRGNWLDETGPVVEPAIPHFLGAIDAPGRRATRLDLARWIVSRDNPLTARVYVNRQWKLFFGQGISKELGDLGSQGEWPTHPELLDYLAVQFMNSGWDMKRMTRLLVTSGAYRQSSFPTPEDKEKDPYNRLYARQSRFRLDAEFVRDNALAISGLLSDSEVGGPSVFPYQPAGYWSALNFPARVWTDDTGDNLYRRGLYTHWQRSFLHPSLLAFDAPTREEAVCERSRSNIPQQALVLLNDPTYVESARIFAEHMIHQGGTQPAERIHWAFEHALDRAPRPRETDTLAELYRKSAAEYAADPASARALLTTGARPADASIPPADLAAWTSVARTILNLNETITRY